MVINNTESLKGFLALLSGTAFFGLLGVFSRMIGMEFGVFNASWVRNLIVLVLVGIYLVRIKKWRRVDKADRKWLVIWSFFGMFTTIGIFVGSNRLTIGSTMLFFYAGMILTSYLGAYVMFREKLNLAKLVSIGLAFLGLMIIYSNAFSFKDALGFWAVFLGGGSNGIWAVLSKKVSKVYDNFQLIFIDALVSVLFCLGIAVCLGERLQLQGFGRSWLVIAIWAVSSLGVIWTAIYGYKKLEAQKATLVLPMRVVFGAFWGYLFYKEVLGVEVLVGGLMILVAAVLPNIVKSKR